MIILVGGQKGGTGKSTCAVNLAAMRKKRGHDVILVDADKQSTTSTWAAVRNEASTEDKSINRITCVQKTGKGFIDDVIDLATRYSDVIIDAGGQDSKELRSGLAVAEMFLCPMQPSHADIWTLELINELIEQVTAHNTRLQSFVFLNRVSTHPNLPETEEAGEFLSDFDSFTAIDIVIRERVTFRRALGLGLSVEELEVDEKATKEMLGLYEFAYGSIEEQATAV